MRQLEKKYSKSERIVIKAKFSCLIFMREVFIAAILGGALGAIWHFAPQIESAITKSADVVYLTDQNLSWALLAIAALVLILALAHAVSLYRKEFIVTENNVISKSGTLLISELMLPIDGIKIVESRQNILQKLLGYGSIIIISDAEKPYKVRHVVNPEKLAQKIVKQTMLTGKRNSMNNMRLQLSPTKPRN